MSGDIVVNDLKKSYRRADDGAERIIFDGLGMTIRAGELVAVVGASGCGKSTLLNIVAGLDRPTRGRITFDGPAAERNLSVVFQQPRLIDWLTAEENISIVFDRLRLAPADAARATAELLAKVQLADHAGAYPQFLSGGQKQRVAIARAFATHPDVLLLDEPFSALDELTARRLRLLLQELWTGEMNHLPTGILVTHNMLEAAFLADRIYVMSGSPARFSAVIPVEVERPRNPDDPALFEVHRAVMAALTPTPDPRASAAATRARPAALPLHPG